MDTKTFRLNLKADASAPGKFTGRASVYGVVDGGNDVVMPGAFSAFLAKNGPRIKVLSQHNPDDVIGFALLTDRPDGLYAEGQLVLDLQSARDMYTRLQNNLIDGLSIGYVANVVSYKGEVRQLHQIDLFEISLCTFPMNTEARVTDVKTGAAAGDLKSSIARFRKSLEIATSDLRARGAVRQKHDVSSAGDRVSAALLKLRQALN
jgi:HK97 family phage prohead protease